jgi:hypothetical protein
MKYVKMLGLLAVAAAALMAFAGTASATLLTSPTGTSYTDKIVAKSEGHAKLLNTELGTTIECESTVEGKIESHGTGVTASGKITKLTFEPCTNSYHVTATQLGELVLHYVSSGTGQLTSNETIVTTTRFGLVCNYETSGTTIGHVTDSHKTGGKATLDISASIPIGAGSSSLCGTANAHWSGSYLVETPSTLYIDH